MTDTTTLALLCENQRAIRHPVEDTAEIIELLDRMELRAALILDEEKHARSLTTLFEQELGVLRQQQEEVNKELQEAQKVAREQQNIHDIIQSFEVTGPVQFEGKEIIVKIHNTRQKEREIMDELDQEEIGLRKRLQELQDHAHKLREQGDHISELMEDYLYALQKGFAPERPDSRERSNSRVDENTDERSGDEPDIAVTQSENDESRPHSEQPEQNNPQQNQPEDVDMDLAIE